MSRRGSKAETHVLGAGWAARECRTARRVGLWCLGRSWDLGWRAGGSKNSSKHAPITRGGRVWLEIRSIDDVLVARCLACRRAGREWARRDGDGGGSPGKCALGAPCQNYAVAVLAQTRPQTIPTARLAPAPASLAWPPLRSRGQRRGMPSDGQRPAASGCHSAAPATQLVVRRSRTLACRASRPRWRPGSLSRGGSIASLPQQHPDGPRAQKHIEICARCLPCPSFSPLACRARCEYNKLCGPPLGLIPAHSAHILLSSPHPAAQQGTVSRSLPSAARPALRPPPRSVSPPPATRDPRPATACCHSYFGRPAGRSLCILP